MIKKLFFCFFLIPLQLFAYSDKDSITKSLPDIPLRFTENKGQWNKQVLFELNSQTSTIYFQNDKLTFYFLKEDEGAEEYERKAAPNGKSKYDVKSHRQEQYTTTSYSLQFLNPNAAAKVVPQQKTSGLAHYLKGSDLSKHVKNVESYNSILYQNVYNGVDVRFYGKGQDLKYDVILHKNTSMDVIKMQYRGIGLISKTEQGDLEITTAEGILIEKKPYSYQRINNKVKQVQVEYIVLNDTTYGFVAAEPYDKNEELIIDPVMLEWATYMGGYGRGYLYDMVTDSAGYIYYTGYYSNTFPVTSGAYNTIYKEITDTSLANNPYQGDVYVIKLAPDAKSIVYSTYIGGDYWDYAYGLQINSAGETFITGVTFSTNFPFTAGTPSVPAGEVDGFVARLNAAGSELLYSAPLSGNGYGIDVNNQNEAFVTGIDNNGAFLFRLSASGNNFIYYNTIARGDQTLGKRIKLFNNQAYVVGFTVVNGAAGALPVTTGALYSNPPSGNNGGGSDVFIYKTDATTGAVLYASYLGGPNLDFADALDMNAQGELLVMGVTSGDFPVTPGAIASTSSFSYFICKLNADLSKFIFSTYLGDAFAGNASVETYTQYGLEDIYSNNNRYIIEGNGDVKYTADNAILFAGFNANSNFPITSDALYGGYKNSSADIIFAVLDSLGNNIVYGTYYSGSQSDYYGPSLAFTNNEHCNQEVILGFTTHSPGLPTLNAVQPTKLNGTYDQPFLLKLNLDYSIPQLNSDTAVCGTTPLKLVAPQGKNYKYLWSNGDTTSTIQAPLTIPYWVKVSNYICSATDTINAIHVSPPALTWPNDTLVCNSLSVLLNVKNPNASYLWSTGDTTQQITITKSGVYSIQIQRKPCIFKDTINIVLSLLPPAVNLGNNAIVCDPQSIKLDAGNAGDTYLWSTGATTQTISVGSDSVYWVQVTDDCGRTVSDTITITQSKLFIPNVFTPNNDGANDTYTIQYNGDENYSLQIYNQWGALVFQTSNRAEVWTGLDIVDGVYYYHTNICGKDYKGWVQLIR